MHQREFNSSSGTLWAGSLPLIFLSYNAPSYLHLFLTVFYYSVSWLFSCHISNTFLLRGCISFGSHGYWVSVVWYILASWQTLIIRVGIGCSGLHHTVVHSSPLDCCILGQSWHWPPWQEQQDAVDVGDWQETWENHLVSEEGEQASVQPHSKDWYLVCLASNIVKS